MKLLEGPVVRQRAEPPVQARRRPYGPSAPPPKPLGDVPRGTLAAAGEAALGLILGATGFVLQVLFYMAAVLAVPLLPFLLPLFLGPVVVVFALLIVGGGKFLTALGSAVGATTL